MMKTIEESMVPINRRRFVGAGLAFALLVSGQAVTANDMTIEAGPKLETVQSFSVKESFSELLVNDDGSIVIGCETLGRMHAFDVSAGVARWTSEGNPTPHRWNETQDIVEWVHHQSKPIAMVETRVSSGKEAGRSPLHLSAPKLWNIAFADRRTNLLAAQIQASPKDQTVIVDIESGEIRHRWDLPDRLDGRPTTIRGLGFDPDGQFVVVAGRDELVICNADGEIRHRYSMPGDNALSVIRCLPAISLAHGTLGSDLIAFGSDLNVLREIPLHAHGVRSSSLCSDHRFLVTGGSVPDTIHVNDSDDQDASAKVVASDIIGRANYESRASFRGPILAVGVSPNSRFVVAHEYDIDESKGRIHVLKRLLSDADVEQVPSKVPIVMPDIKSRKSSDRRVPLSLAADGSVKWSGEPVTRKTMRSKIQELSTEDRVELVVVMSEETKLSTMLDLQDWLAEHLPDQAEITFKVE